MIANCEIPMVIVSVHEFNCTTRNGDIRGLDLAGSNFKPSENREMECKDDIAVKHGTRVGAVDGHQSMLGFMAVKYP